jgi:hypothetical protein
LAEKQGSQFDASMRLKKECKDEGGNYRGGGRVRGTIKNQFKRLT